MIIILEEYMRGLAFRRFQQVKHKRRAWRHLRNNCFSPEERTPRRVGIHAAMPKVCSCFMCGNPRRYYRERTLQERRQCQAWLFPENTDACREKCRS